MMRLKYAAAALLFAATAAAQTGVSDDRVSLPEGPGSQQGVGDNAVVNPNMGSMAYSVPIDVPAGFEGVTPNLALSYSSSGANGILGYGWSLSVPFIERMTNRGLPTYDGEDLFVSDGGNQLVRVEAGDVPTYRSRFEGAFVRYKWHDVGNGSAGYWTAETRDGNTLYFGADQNGAPDQNAQFRGRLGTFRYQLVNVVDRFGHHAEYSYRNVDGLPYLDAIRYTFTEGAAASTVRFTYEGRDDAVSDARSGSNELMSQRLAAVEVFAGETRIWRYDVTYEGYDVANGQSRVAQINRVGLDNTPDPVVYGFEYSKTLGGACDADCGVPVLVDMGDLGVNLGAGDATLIDINGDALPDVVDTSLPGMHRFFINRLDPAGAHAFDAVYRSEVGDQSGHQLSSPYVQVLDVNGDGRADVVNALTGEVLHNMGGGDWAAAPEIGNNTLPDFGEDFAVGAEELTSVRFLDYDMDKRIDVLLSRDQTTQVWRNGAGGFTLDETVESIGAGFSDTRLQMADMNGDGLQDPVILASGTLRWRMNLGWGQWSAWREIEALPFNEAELDFVELEDINGDGMDDVVLVLADQLRYALNRGGDRFDPAQTIDAAGGRALPTRTNDTTVLYADMNGSGSDDVVWITAGGEVTYLELFPLRPNLLSRITNGLGMVTDVSYITSASAQAQDPDEWAHSLPFPMLMVSSVDTYDAMSDLHQVVRYSYHSGYYDTEEKTFRGFSQVELLSEGDESQQAAHMLQIYDVGAEDTYRNGLLLSQQVSGVPDDGGVPTPLRSSTFEFEDCPLTGIPGDLSVPIRFICGTADEAQIQESADPADWVTTRSERIYDGYGNVTLSSALGVSAIGAGGCPQIDRPAEMFGAPSGEGCVGDERYTETDYIAPAANGLWLLGTPWRVRGYAAPGGDYTERLTYYDGEAFAGGPQGTLTLGLPTRILTRVDDATQIISSRSAYDAHGNATEQLDPRNDAQGAGYRTRYTFDDDGLLVLQTERELVAADGSTYVLRQQSGFDPNWGTISEQSDWITVVGGEALTAPSTTQFAYDGLGRMIAIAQAGDSLDRPTKQFAHEHGMPPSRVVERGRSVAGARLPDLETIRCLDGFGRMYQSRSLVTPGQYEVSGYKTFNRRSQAIELYRGYTSDSADCDVEPPDSPRVSVAFDALGRAVRSTLPDAALFDTASTSKTERAPLAEMHHDASDTDPSSPFFNTPRIVRYDGLARAVEVELVERPGEAGVVYQIDYDAFGSLRRLMGPEGDERLQFSDAAGRVIRTESANRGVTTYEYDDVGGRTRREDAAGRVSRVTFDALGRVVEHWDESDRDNTVIQFQYDNPAYCGDGACAHAGAELVRVSYPYNGGRATIQPIRDARHQTIGETHVLGGVTFGFGRARDNQGRVIAETLPDGTRLDYTLDGLNRTIGIDGVLDEAQYHLGGLLSSLTLANGSQESWGRDVVDRIDTHRVTDAAGTAIVDLAYGYQRDGLLVTAEDHAQMEDQPGLGASYTYDALAQLIGTTLDEGRPGFEERLTYVYDARLNMVEKRSSLGAASAAHVGVLTYGEGAGPHAVTSAGASVHQYDPSGYLVERDGTSLSWDWLGRLVEANHGGATVATYSYGPNLQRVGVVEGAHHRIELSTTFEVEDGMALVHVVFGDRRLATIESSAMAADVLTDVAPGALDGARFVPSPDGLMTAGDAIVAAQSTLGTLTIDGVESVSGTQEILASSVRRLLLQGTSRTTFNHHDRYGNLVAVTSGDGVVVERHGHYPSGQPRTAPVEGETTLTYAGRRTDPSTAMTYFGTRYHDAGIGRWTAPDFRFEVLALVDAIEKPREAMSGYVYNLNNPITYRDRNGEAAGDPEAPEVPSGLAAMSSGVHRLVSLQQRIGLLRHLINRDEAQLVTLRAEKGSKAQKKWLALDKRVRLKKLDKKRLLTKLDSHIAQATKSAATFSGPKKNTSATAKPTQQRVVSEPYFKAPKLVRPNVLSQLRALSGASSPAAFKGSPGHREGRREDRGKRKKARAANRKAP